MDRDADGAGLVRDGAGDGLPDPPGGIGGKAETAGAVELFGRLDQADVPLLDEVQESQIVAHMFFGDGHDQAQVGLTEAAAGVQTVLPGLQQLLPLFVAQRAVLHSLHGFLFLGGVLSGILGAFLVPAVLRVLCILRLLIVGGIFVLLKGEAGGILFDVIGAVVLAAVGLQDAGRLGARVDATAQLHLLLRRQQGDLADLLQVILDGVVQQLVHGGLQVGGVLLDVVVLRLIVVGLVGAVLGALHLGQDAVHIQRGLVLLDLDAPFFQNGVQAFGIQTALLGQCAHLVGVDGAIACALAQHLF